MTKVAVIGCGMWGTNLVRNFHSLGALKSACDFDENKLNKLAQELPGVAFTKNYEEILSDKEIDAVAIATPPVTHYEVAVKALEASKNVFVEKPLTLNIADSRKLIETARKKGLILMVGHLLLYHPSILKLKELIMAGALGDVFHLFSRRLNTGRVRREENVLWSLAPHDIAVMLFLLDEEPVEISCVGGKYIQKEIEDVAFLTLIFSNGRVGNIHVSWLNPEKERKLMVVGSRGMAVVDEVNPNKKLVLFDKYVDPQTLQIKGTEVQVVPVPDEEPLRAECRHFLECVAEKKPPRLPTT
ncbi:MAG: Gfo/Idh/MocA family oxidoreductase, partial [Firmicutes bacterium]|nr:Gfo/Idh/MocA family oxidoreductase [Bacillota bacterium]